MGDKTLPLVTLGRSRVRDSILGLLFANENQEYFSRQLERLLGFPASMIQRELARLEKSDFLTARWLGRLKLYKLNFRHPLFPELKRLVEKTVGLPSLLTRQLRKVEGVESASIHGSFARGGENWRSDIDLLIVGSVRENDLIRVLKEVEGIVQRDINYSVYSRKEWTEKVTTGDPFVIHFLKQPGIPLIGEIAGTSAPEDLGLAQE